MTDIQWEDPPAGASPGRKGYAEFWEALRANPGQWARFPGKVNSIRRTDEYEVATRKIDGERVGYARYIGDGQPA